MNSVDQVGFLLDYIQGAAHAARRGADLPTLALELLPNGEIAPLEGYGSEEDARRGYLHAPHPKPISAPDIEPVGLSVNEGAKYLGITPDQVRGFIGDGELHYINVGRGKKRPRIRLIIPDLDEFIEHRKRRDAPCPSTRKSTRHIISSTSDSTVVGFSALRAAQLARKPKNSKR